MRSILFLGLLSLSSATPLKSRYVVKETHRAPAGFSNLGEAPANHNIRLSVGLKQSQFGELERHLYEGESEVYT